MTYWRIWRLVLGGALLVMAGGAGAQKAASLSVLRAVERGEWQLKEAAGSTRKLCVTNPAALLQIRHQGMKCERVVMESTPSSATVRYNCAGHGQGRTTLTVETGKVIRIETQGVADGAPFLDEYEGRLLGRCG